MERASKPTSKKTKTAKKRANSGKTDQDPLRKRRITRSMQRKMMSAQSDVEMKENSAVTETTMPMLHQSNMETTPAGCVSRLQKQCAQLSCKENVLDYEEGLGHSIEMTSGPLRLIQQQQQPSLYAHHHQQNHHLEVNRESILEQALDASIPVTSSGYADQFSSSDVNSGGVQGHIYRGKAPQRQQQAHHQNCKLKISQFMSSENPEHSSKMNPLPQLQWVRSADLWRTMRSKDVSKVAPDSDLRLKHPGILSNMRMILLDWLMEVCEEYKLHRETYYLAMDMFDRFMDARTGVRKEQLQLLGVTCLFIASKIEEIYPPKAADFAYVTDGACSVSGLLETELIICKVLNWRLNHNIVTVNTWVNIFMQLGSHHLRPPGMKAKEFVLPAYSCVEFTRIMKLLDLCSLDVTSRQFGNSVLAASAVYLQSERSRANLTLTTGFELSDIQMCVNWMHPSSVVLGQSLNSGQKTFPGVNPHDVHNIQTHEVSIAMLEDTIELRQNQDVMPSPYTLLPDCSVLMTPPRSERRCLAPINTPC